MKAFSFKKQNKEDQFEFTDANYMKRGSPELTPSDDHVWVTAPFVAFDSFDLWHGAAKWDGDAKGELCNAARDVMRARQEAAKGRVSMELRFRARYKPEKSEGGGRACRSRRSPRRTEEGRSPRTPSGRAEGRTISQR